LLEPPVGDARENGLEGWKLLLPVGLAEEGGVIIPEAESACGFLLISKALWLGGWRALLLLWTP
jgi:hypothetical protein